MLYRERLTVPLLWWLLAVGFAVSMLGAFGFYLGWRWGVGTALASLAVAVAIFQSSAVLITVEPTRLSRQCVVVLLHRVEPAAGETRGSG